MKVAKILGIVFGAFFLLTGIGLLAAANSSDAGGSGADRRLAEQGLTGPVEGRVTAVQDPIYTVEYTDKQGAAQTGRGAVADGTTPPAQGDDVQVYYSTTDPSQVIILDFPGGTFAGVAGLLRTIGIVCLVIGAVLLLAGILGLVIGRKRAPAVTAGPAGYAPPATLEAAQSGQFTPSGPTQAPPPDAGQAYPPQSAPTPTDPSGSDLGGSTGQPYDPGTLQDPPPPAGHNHPGG